MKKQEEKSTQTIIFRFSEDDERKAIEENTERTSYGVSVYLRNLRLGHELTSRIDQKAVLNSL